MITGLFGADFTAFKTAVDGAEVKLKGFETNANTVEKSLGRIGDQFSGKKVIQEAELMAAAIDKLGGVSVLTEKELQRVGATAQEAAAKMKAVGQDVPDNVQKYADAAKNADGATSGWGVSLGNVGSILASFGITLTVEALVSMTKEIFASASALEKMHAQTDISVENLQRMQMVGDGVGVSLDTMTKAATKLEAALGAGDKGTAAALQNLNIDIEHFTSLGAADRFEEVSKAVRGMEDPLKAAADLQAIYGKNWAELFPVLKAGFKDAGDDVTVMSSQTVKALDDAGNAIGEFWRATKANLGEAFGDILTGTTSEWRRLKSGIEEATVAAAKMHPEGLVPLAKGLVDVTDAAKLLNDGLDDQKTKLDGDVAAQKKYNDAWVELNSVGDTWQDTLLGINAETINFAKYALDAGASQGAVATGLHLTDVQVRAITESMKEAVEIQKTWLKLETDTHTLALKNFKDEEDARKKSTDAMNKTVVTGLTEIQKARAETRDLEMKAVLSETDYEIVKVWDVNKEKKLAFGGSVQQRQEYNDAVDALSTAQEQSILEKTWHAADEGGRAMKQLGDDAKQAKDEIDKAAAAATSMQGGTSLPGSTQITAPGGQRYLVSPDGHRVPIGPHGELPPNWFEMYTGQTTFAGMAGGGPVEAGTGYIVGEQGPELFVPSQSGAIVPNRGGGGTVITNHINVNGTAQDVARQVAAEIMRTIKAGQQLGAAGT